MMPTRDQPPTLRHEPPSPETNRAPAPALGSRRDLARSASDGSALSYGSSTDGSVRDSLSSGAFSRHSSASYESSRLSSDMSLASKRTSAISLGGTSIASKRTSTISVGGKRRGYTRPQGTDFAESAKQRESVLSLGSISHLQYYFARTGLLDGKGGQLARKRNPRATLDLSQLDPAAYLNPKTASSDADSSYASLASSPDFGAQNLGGPVVDSPLEDNDGFDSDEFEEPDHDVLPPTTSTYMHREKHIPKPPTVEELKSELTQTLDAAAKVLVETAPSNNDAPPPVPAGEKPKSKQGWYEVQGMQLLDVMTLAIRAAKVYYTSHEYPDRLDTIKSEKEIRTELLSVMEVLKQMATRDFSGGTRDSEHQIMLSWIESIRDMLRKELEIEDAESKERASWTWVAGDWSGRETERELAFLASLAKDEDPLPPFTPCDKAAELPTPFLSSLQNGLRLVKFHNAAVRKSKKRFGAIPTFHTDTQKPYRCADNLRYWAKAAELRWEVMLKIDALGIVYNNNPQVWIDFEAAIFQWCRKVREEVTAGWQE